MTSQPLGGGVSSLCDDNNKAFVQKSLTMGGGGVKKYQILRDAIYGRPLSKILNYKISYQD